MQTVLILAFIIIGVFVPFVVRQEKRRKAEFKARKRRLIEIGLESDNDDDALTRPQVRRTSRQTDVLVKDPNPYRPPKEV